MYTTPSTPVRTLFAGAILSALAFNVSTVSSAEEDTSPPQVIVKFGDLNPSTSQGAAALYGRIHSAADSVCWRMYQSTGAYKQHKDECLQKVIADAVSKVDKSALTAIFTSKYGAPAPVPAVVAAAGTR
jgi:UrcA family protein